MTDEHEQRQVASKEIVYSEIFHSVQGEGRYTGVPTAWLRFYLCNLQCDGFGQKNPKDPSTYDLPYQTINIASIKKLEDLPVWKYGCDSSYSWAKKFKHLQHKGTARQIVQRIRESMYHPLNPSGHFNYILPNLSHIEQHMCFTGGEPLMKHAQKAACDIIDEMAIDGDFPRFVTWETNGTQELSQEFLRYFVEYPAEKFLSISPKLFSVSGEGAEKAINPGLVAFYQKHFATDGQLKFVINGTQDSWEELEDVVHKFRYAGVNWPIWIMPVGSVVEAQQGTLANYMSAGQIATEAFKRGYNVAARVHTYLWGNLMGT
jgi:6-pyruvoyltetrahydropterin 2'-reductase